MEGVKIERALISVFNKEGILDFAKYLDSQGIEIISTSKTAKILGEAGVRVTKIESITGFPEILGGRVKTLHPNIFGGILSRRDSTKDLESCKSHGIKPIDMVVVNLYPFAKTIKNPRVTLEEAIENIDIGGPSMIRASAKNFRHVAVVTDVSDYSSITEEMKSNSGVISYETRSRLASKAFKLTSEYDTHIKNYLENLGKDSREAPLLPPDLYLKMTKISSLRYGENPHQNAAVYSVLGWPLEGSLAGAKPLQGKEISFNNLMDAQGAINVVRDIEEKYVAAIIKHTNPCGVGRSDDNLLDAYRLALECDPVSAFGGIVCLNAPIDGEIASEINKIFTEVVIAPDFTEDARKIFSKKKNLRLLRLEPQKPNDLDLKFIDGGVLLQKADGVSDDLKDARVVTERKPSAEENSKLKFAMNICKNVKSNAIVIANAKQSVGVGAGQTSRVDSCKIAIMKARVPLSGCVLASDAFFPFRDSIDLAAKEGITAVIQPGGSLKDQEVIDACNEHKIAMIFTGIRHFKH